MPEFSVKPFALPPEEAIKYFEAKGFAITWDWREQATLNNSQVFTVAKAMKMDILQDVRGMMDSALKEGLSFKEFQKSLEPRLRAKGWWGKQLVDGKRVQLGSPWRLRTIYDQNITSSFGAGRWKAQTENKAIRPYLRYEAIRDARTRPAHRAWHGVIKRVDSLWWRTHYPPNGYLCRCVARSLTPEQAKKLGGVTSTGKIPKVDGKVLKPDPGFSNNPGIDRWKPIASDYPSDIWEAQKKTPSKKISIGGSSVLLPVSGILSKVPKELPEGEK